MRRAFAAACAALLSAAAGCTRVAIARSPGGDLSHIKRIGILPFQMPAKYADRTASRTDQLIKDFMLAGFEVVDRQHLDHVVKELGLQTSGAVDPKTVAELGRILGIQGLVVPTLHLPGFAGRMGHEHELKLIDIQTARILWFITVNTGPDARIPDRGKVVAALQSLRR